MIGKDLSRWIYHFIPTFWIKSICLWAMLNVHSLWSSTTISPSLWGSCLKRQKLFHYVLWSHCLAPTLLMFQENRSAINLFFHLIYSFEEHLIFLTSISLPIRHLAISPFSSISRFTREENECCSSFSRSSLCFPDYSPPHYAPALPGTAYVYQEGGW